MPRTKIMRMIFVMAGTVIGLLFLLFFTACGDSQPTSSAETHSSTASPPADSTTSSTTSPGTHTITIDGHTLTVPDGLTIERWVSGRDTLRMMAVTDDGLLLVTEMGKGNVLGYDLAEDRPQPITVVKGLSHPSGITMHDEFLFVAEETSILRYEYKGAGTIGEKQTIIAGLPSGGHATRTIGVGPDRRLYLAVGSSCNICEEKDPRRAAMSRFNIDGSGGEIIASGLRNTVGFTWQPLTGEIWGVDNGRDGIGDDLPPDEVNIIMQGKNYGWPYCYGSFMVNPEYVEDREKARFCEATEPPAVELQAHSAPLGLRFLNDPVWPADYQQNLFIALHGSWNRTVPTGYKVVRVDRDRRVTDFITGWLDEKTGKAWGRPVDILFADNKMYITDDASGSIYRVTRSI